MFEVLGFFWFSFLLFYVQAMATIDSMWHMWHEHISFL